MSRVLRTREEKQLYRIKTVDGGQHFGINNFHIHILVFLETDGFDAYGIIEYS